MNAVSAITEDRRAAFGELPVSPDQPAGADARALPEFDLLDGEIRKIDSGGVNAVDWKLVAENGLEIIQHQSKDMLVGAWITYALFRREDLAGLAVGLAILRGIVTTHWDGAFPPARRERARVAAFEWLVTRLSPALSERSFTAEEGPRLVALQDELEALDTELTGKLVKESQNLFDLIRVLRPNVETARRALAEAAQAREAEQQRIETEAANRAAAADAAAAAPPSSEQPTAAAAPAAAPAVSGGPVHDVDALAGTLWATARALFDNAPTDPRAYLLGRIGSWLRIDALPGGEGGKTLVMPPPDLDTIEPLIAQEQFQAALGVAEGLAWTAPFCLDAHRLSRDILGRMGPGFAAARDAVGAAVASIVLRFPAVVDLSFGDGRPFADKATREMLASLGGGGGGKSAAADPMDQAVGQARTMLGTGKVFEALELLAATLREATSGRQRVRWQVEQARFCIDQGFVAAALPLLDHLEGLVEARDLESWEPDLACAVTTLRMRALMHPVSQAVMLDERRTRAIETTRGRLARLDIAATARTLVAG